MIITDLPPEVKKGQLVCFDFETFGQTWGKLHRPTGTFACISVAIEGDKNEYQLYDSHDLKKLYQLIKKGTWVCHNALYDLRQFRRYVPNLQPHYVHDTMLVDQSMCGGLYQTYGLADLSRRWLEELMEKDVREDFGHMTEMTPAMKRYAAKDARKTLQIAQKQIAKYSDDMGFRAYQVADEPMLWPVMDMPGFRVDAGAWLEMAKVFEQRGTSIQAELGINVKSNPQVIDAARKHGIHLQSTGKDVLAEYADNEFIAKVLEARLYRDAASKYGQKWLENNVESDGKVYADFHIVGSEQTGVKTGRMSCADPNLQNIPQRKLPEYRAKFIASDGAVIDVSDVKQQEPCITAWHTQDQHLLSAIQNHEDLHLAVARRIFNDPSLTKEDKEKRSIGKAINLGMTYGLTAFGLAERTGMSDQEAQSVITKYFRNYAGVFAWIGRQRQTGYKQGFVITALGRRAYLNLYDRRWENNAINSPIQGGAADMTKVWARKYWEACRKADIPYTTVAFVHDETVKDTPREVEKLSQKLNEQAFQEAATLLYKGVPFEIEVETGRSWAAKSIASEAVELGDEE